MTNNYLTNLQEASEKKRMTSIIKIQAHNLQKFVEARDEYQTHSTQQVNL